ncbi:type 2 periplasmic-binding domain-containing protein [Kordiimonas aestuarii]|uniref:hypothetical protein n=1 Tax=Kordiimonas aestuarii TaxID=1005925 RepID=UPI0021CF2239|nr:hypothetical protein [Kordiimonas aestuarii]
MSCEFLARIGFPADKIIPVPNHGYPLVNMVNAKRADAYVNDKHFNAIQLREAGLPSETMQSAMLIENRGGFYFAAGLQVDAALRNRVQRAYARLVKSGDYEMLIMDMQNLK